MLARRVASIGSYAYTNIATILSHCRTPGGSPQSYAIFRVSRFDQGTSIFVHSASYQANRTPANVYQSRVEWGIERSNATQTGMSTLHPWTSETGKTEPDSILPAIEKTLCRCYLQTVVDSSTAWTECLSPGGYKLLFGEKQGESPGTRPARSNACLGALSRGICDRSTERFATWELQACRRVGCLRRAAQHLDGGLNCPHRLRSEPSVSELNREAHGRSCKNSLLRLCKTLIGRSKRPPPKLINNNSKSSCSVYNLHLLKKGGQVRAGKRIKACS
jgi:hypothetical protein